MAKTSAISPTEIKQSSVLDGLMTSEIALVQPGSLFLAIQPMKTPHRIFPKLPTVTISQSLTEGTSSTVGSPMLRQFTQQV